MPRILPELYNLGYVAVKQPRKGTTGKGSANQIRVMQKPPGP